jgi:hypothetical protein
VVTTVKANQNPRKSAGKTQLPPSAIIFCG